MSELQSLARSIAELAQPGMSPKSLFEAVRKRHPKATKKDVRRAAFYAVILASEADPDAVSGLHEMALRSRADGDEDL